MVLDDDSDDDVLIDEYGAEPGLVALLRGLATTGLGTVLGGVARSGRGLVRRVGRTATREDAERLEALFHEHRGSMVAYASRHADAGYAEDVVQRAFEKIWKRQPVLADLDSPKAYLVTAVRNEIHREVRREGTLRDRTDADGATALELRRAPVDVSAQVSARLTVRAELDKLSPREREAVVLRVQWQLSVDEAAEVMGVSTGSVKSYTFHGLRKLKEALDVA